MPHEETSHSFNVDLPEDFQPTPTVSTRHPVAKLYQYECEFCGVKLTANWLVTLPMKCVDHKTLLRVRDAK